jgi:hypothetical protein
LVDTATCSLNIHYSVLYLVGMSTQVAVDTDIQ